MAGEARAALHAISLQVTNAINDGDHSNATDVGIYLEEIFSICRSFTSFSCTFVRRSCNTLAHALAHLYICRSLIRLLLTEMRFHRFGSLIYKSALLQNIL